MNEEILIRMGLDASAVKRGTMVMLDQQKKAANETAAAWEKAQSRIMAAENKTQKSMRDARDETKRQINAEIQLRQRAWRQERDAQRSARVSFAGGSVGNRVTGSASGHLRGGSSGAIGEVGVLARELMAGNGGGFARSLSVLASRMGWLGKAASLAINPITGIAAGLAAGAAGVYGAGASARKTMLGARGIGFSTAGYQTLQTQSSMLGEGAAAMAGAGHLSGMVGSAKLGDTGAVRRFDQLGINIAGKNNEQIYAEAIDKVASTADPVRKAALALELFGQNIKDIERTINNSGNGTNPGKVSSGNLAVLANTGDSTVGAMMRGGKLVLNEIAAAGKDFYAEYSKAVNKGSRQLAEGTREGELIDAKIAAFKEGGLVKTHTVREAGYRRMMAQQNPELDIQLTEAQRAQREASANLDDRGKVDLSTMADAARQFTGHIRPRLYTVTDRQRTAMNIDDLDAKATNAFLQGDDEKFKKLRGEADEMRKANPWMKLNDTNPTARMEDELKKANKTLEVVERAANLIINPTP